MIDEEKEKARAKADGIEKFATGVAVLKGGKVLVVRRVPNDYLGGMYELPGGSVDPGESIDEGAKRELLEETGLVATELVATFGGFDYKTPKPTSVRQFNFVANVEDFEVKLDPDEHDEYKWVGLAELESLQTTDVMRRVIESIPGLSK